MALHTNPNDPWTIRSAILLNMMLALFAWIVAFYIIIARDEIPFLDKSLLLAILSVIVLFVIGFLIFWYCIKVWKKGKLDKYE